MQSQNDVNTVSNGIRHHPRRLPLQNVLLAAFVIAVFAVLAEVLNAATGIPFGRRASGESGSSASLSLRLAVLPAVCVVALLSSRGVAQLLLLPRRQSGRHGYWLLALNALLGTLSLAVLDFWATQVTHWWHWDDGAWRWEGITLPNVAGTMCVNVLALLLATPALINKHPGQPAPALAPLVVWFGLNLALLAGCVSRASDAAVAVLAAPVALVTVLAYQVHRRAVMNCGQAARQE